MKLFIISNFPIYNHAIIEAFKAMIPYMLTNIMSCKAYHGWHWLRHYLCSWRTGSTSYNWPCPLFTDGRDSLTEIDVKLAKFSPYLFFGSLFCSIDKRKIRILWSDNFEDSRNEATKFANKLRRRNCYKFNFWSP